MTSDTTTVLATVQQGERTGDERASVTVALPTTTPDAAQQLVGTLLGRHELLASRLVPAPGSLAGVAQQVSDNPSLTWHRSDQGSEGTTDAGPFRAVVDASGVPQGVAVTLSVPATYVDTAGLLVLARDLVAAAAGEQLGEPVQNSQYATWQAETAESVTVDPAELRRVFAAAAPGAGPSRQAQVGGLDTVTVDVPASRWGPIAAAAARLDADIEPVLVAAWLAYLQRTGRNATLCGVYTDHRTAYDDLADTVGVLSRYLPLPLATNDDDTADEAFRRVAKARADVMALLDTFAWRHLPPGGHPCDSRDPRGPVLFGAHRVASPSLLDAVSLVEPSHRPTLSVQVLYSHERASVRVVHPTGPGAAERARDEATRFIALLEHFVRQPETPVVELSLLSPDEEQRLLAGFGGAPETVPLVDATVYALFARQVQATPDRLAVVAGQHRWTYAELDERAGQIAAALGARGVPPGSIVGLLLDRGVEMVAAVLGVWRAGLAYVPVDAATPAERIAFVLADSAARLLVTDSADVPDLGADGPAVVRLADLTDAAGEAADAAPGDSRGLAYVIYTSGTTGQPKGVMIEHRSAVHLAYAHRERIYRHHDPDGAGLSATLNASLAFDGAVERILLLTSGNTLYVVDEDARRDPAAFVDYVRANDVQVLDVTPSFLGAALHAGLLEQPGYRPRVVLVGGEAIAVSLWRTLADSGVAFYNVYGPTETTVNAAVGRVVGERPHLGLALPNTRLYILDRSRRPVPVGVTGEVYVAGAGVGRGYLNRSELTEQKFSTNPFAPADTVYGRIYATGDLGRFLPDGTIEFLGRNDGQVKLRGFRIETGEITAVICRDADVTDALVTLHGDDADSRQLVAYVVAPAHSHTGLVERLRGRLTDQLPSYMVPTDVCVLEAWPLTTNGKVDVAALPAPGAVTPDLPPPSYVAPRGAVEEGVAAIWAELLERPHIGAQDNFFEVGGHSLLVPVMLKRVGTRFGVPLPMRTIFVAATVADLAATVAAAGGSAPR